MHKLQQLQALGNCCLSLIGFSSFIIIVNYIRLTNCTAYHSFQTNAAFSFILIFVPWLGIIGALKAKKMIVYIYLTIIAIILLVYLITCIIIFSNSNVRAYCKLARDTDSIDILAVLEGLLVSYNMLIAQIILVWIFLVGTGVATYFATKQQEEDGIHESLQS